MIFTTKMTQKGQVTIPKHIRDRFAEKTKGDFWVDFDEDRGEVRLKPLLTLEELAGSLKSNVSLSDKDLRSAREAFGRTWPQE